MFSLKMHLQKRNINPEKPRQVFDLSNLAMVMTFLLDNHHSKI